MADSSFYSAVLRGLGLEVTPFRLNFLTQWAQHENTGAKYNPLATTQQGGEDPNDPYWNSNGGNPVKNYASFENGVAATVKTLRNGYYPQVIQSLQSEQVVPGTSDNVRTWGTVGFANTLDSGPLASEGTMTAPVDVPKLPFSDSDFQIKYAHWSALNTALYDPITGGFAKGVTADDPRFQELASLEADLSLYQQAKDSGAQDWGTAIARGTYEGSNDPRNVAADDAAAKAARQFQINQTAGEFTQQDLTEQRSQQNDAETSMNNALTGPAYAFHGFRVPSFELASKDDLYKKNIDRVMQNMPDVPGHVPGPSLGLPPLPSQFQGPQQQSGPVGLATSALGGGHTTSSQLPPVPSLSANTFDLPALPTSNGYDRFSPGGPIGAQARRRGINGSILYGGR